MAFFRYVVSTLLLERLAETYPWPRSKEEVPAWFYIAADMAMRLHGNHAFQGFPWVVSTGGMLAAFGPKLGAKQIDQETGQLRIECPGFNEKNAYPRQTPCDPDFLRKIAKVKREYGMDVTIVYTDNYYAVFDKLDYTDMVLAVPEAAREKLRELIRRKRSRSRVSSATDASP